MVATRSSPHPALRWLRFGFFASLLSAALFAACNRSKTRPPEVPKVPTLRIYVASTLAGALEPCGCRKDMLGGVDHAARLIEQGKSEAPHSLVLGAGPMLFMNPELTSERRTQDTWKAESIADALREIGLVAWAPGTNDFAAGSAFLSELVSRSQAKLVAANVSVKDLHVTSHHIVEVEGQRVGVAGVSLPKDTAKIPDAVGVSAIEPALQRARMAFDEAKVALRVALVSADRGEALRLAERVPGFQLMIVGKAVDRGESNDAPTPPVMIGETLVVQAPNHLQALGVVDLYIRDGNLRFRDASGIQTAEERQSLERRIEEIERRIESWQKEGAKPEDIAGRKRDVETMKARLSELKTPKPPDEGSFFRYDLREVREGLGSDPRVHARMADYYRRVNQHNRERFKDRKPEAVQPGKPSYVGIARCAECHEEAVEFWKTTGHAQAYKTLVDDHKEFNLDCVNCHVTGYERPGGSTVTFVENLKDVQCEECHGPGSLHSDTEDTELIQLRPEKSVCVKCHHAPHVLDTWSADETWPHIVGKGHGENSKP